MGAGDASDRAPTATDRMSRLRLVIGQEVVFGGGRRAPVSPLADAPNVMQSHGREGGMSVILNRGGGGREGGGKFYSAVTDFFWRVQCCALLGASHAPNLRWKRTSPDLHTCERSQDSSFSPKHSELSVFVFSLQAASQE